MASHNSNESDDTSPVVKLKHDFKMSRKVTRRRGKVMSDLKSEVQTGSGFNSSWLYLSVALLALALTSDLWLLLYDLVLHTGP